MSPNQKNILKEALVAVAGILLAVLSYLAVEMRADVKETQVSLSQFRQNQVIRDAGQDSTLGAILQDMRYIRSGIDDIRKVLKDE